MDQKTIENNFTYHAPNKIQQTIYNALRVHAKILATFINNNCPDSKEKSIAINKLEESIMWANACVARNEDKFIDIDGLDDIDEKHFKEG